MKTQAKRKSGQSETSEGKIRLNKALADAGVASRRKADELIAAGRVQVNNKVVRELGFRVSGKDKLRVDGEPVRRDGGYRYILLNKPKDTITTTSDERGRRTVIDLIDSHDRLYPVGRLDRQTTGLLLLTNDGELAFRMTHPRYEIEREYRVQLDRPISFDAARRIAEGVEISRGEQSQPCQVILDDDKINLTVILREGKNREIRRMFAAHGFKVRKLHRRSYAGLKATGLKRGEWRELKRGEVRELRGRLKLR
ncbi:MAG: rRNA pseudouridine synthase [Chlorobi bacterium]|nr:rRNA pseudouridine synthase [Chlorobiota bacterium]